MFFRMTDRKKYKPKVVDTSEKMKRKKSCNDPPSSPSLKKKCNHPPSIDLSSNDPTSTNPIDPTSTNLVDPSFNTSNLSNSTLNPSSSSNPI
ncbi:unnamed protein product [Ilex paraguariensis]|uniref:Uncharacterized protein n=1 Tax=Ilex paraguariensis TaxID=185542 RepID=A0ABC8T6R0_9AQUA